MQQTDCLIGIEDQQDRVRINDRTQKTMQMTNSRLRPIIYTRNAASSLRNCTWQTASHQDKASTNPWCCFRDVRGNVPLGYYSNGSSTQTKRNTPTPDVEQRKDTESQTSPTRRLPLQKSGFDAEPFLENETRSTRVSCLNSSQKNQTETHETKTNKTANRGGDDNNPSSTKKHQKLKKCLWGIKERNELYMPLSSTIVLRRKKRNTVSYFQTSKMAEN